MRHLGDPCTHSCHQHSVTALGFNLVRDQGGQGLAYLHSSALTTTWDLRGATPLITPNSSYPAYLPGILIGVLTSARPWCHTWTGELLSVSAWLHVSLLSGYTVKQTARDAHSAITTALATSSHSHSQTVNFMNSILPHLPMAHCCHVSFCAAWLQNPWPTAAMSRFAPRGSRNAHIGQDPATVAGACHHSYHQMGSQAPGVLTGPCFQDMPQPYDPVTTCAPNGALCVCDEVATPGSSSFWPVHMSRHESSATCFNPADNLWACGTSSEGGYKHELTPVNHATLLGYIPVPKRTLPTFVFHGLMRLFW